MTLAQAAVEVGKEITLNTVIDGFAAVAALYLIRLVLKMDKAVDSLVIAWFGDPKSTSPNGAKRKLEEVSRQLHTHSDAFREHCLNETAWQEGIATNMNTKHNEFQGTLSNIELQLERRKRPR